jgi:hypothetical protein
MAIGRTKDGSNNISNTSSNTSGCNETSSNCVVWQGPDLPCIDVCNGDTISDILAKLCDELLNTTTVSPGVDIATVNQACLTAEYGTANDIQTLLNNIIDKLCRCCESSGTHTDPCSCVIPLPNCLKYYDEHTGNQITHLPLYDSTTGFGYATVMANKICQNIAAIVQINTTLSNHEGRITYIEQNCCHTHTGTSEGASARLSGENVVPSYVGTPGVPAPLAKVLVATEQTLGELERATGSPTAINTALNVAPALSSREVLSGRGTYSGIAQWNTSPTNMAQSFQNLWITMNDTRNAVQSMKETVANPLCGDITYSVNGSIVRTEEGNFNYISLDFQESIIPTSYNDCNSQGTKITITDASLNSKIFYADVSGHYQNNNAYQIAAANMGNLDLGSNYSVKVDFCSSNGDNMCQEIQNFTIDNELVCPDINIGTVTADTIPYTISNITIPANAGHTISVMLRTSSGTLLDSRSYTAFGSGISGSFTNLSGATLYQVLIEVVRKGATTSTQCAIQNVSTTAPVCTTVHYQSSSAQWYTGTTADTNLQSGANTIVLATYNDGVSSQTKWTVGFDTTNTPIVVQDTDVTDTTGWVHNGSFINDELATAPLVMTGLTGSPLVPFNINRTNDDSGWKYFGSLQDPTGNLFYVYGSVNTTTNSINDVIFGCNCSALYLDTPQPVYYCQKGNTIETTIDAVGYTASGGSYSWSITTQPTHGTLVNVSGYPTASQTRYNYSHDNTNMVSDSYTVSLTNDCGTVVLNKKVAILPATRIKYTTSDVIVFFDSNSMTTANANDIKNSFNNIRAGFSGTKPNFYYVALVGSGATPSGDYIKHVKACIENIGAYEGFVGGPSATSSQSVTIASTGLWYTDVMASGATLPAYWADAYTGGFPPDIKIISFVNNVTTSGSVGLYTSATTVPTDWTGMGPTSSGGSVPYEYMEDYDGLIDIMSSVAPTSAWGIACQGQTDFPWNSGSIPFTFSQVVVNLVADDAGITATSVLQQFAAAQGATLLTSQEYGGTAIGLRQRKWDGITGINLASHLDSTVTGIAIPYSGTTPAPAANVIQGLKDQMNMDISVHAYIENGVDLDNSVNTDITTYFRGMMALKPTGSAGEPISEGYTIIGSSAKNFGFSMTSAVAACIAAATPVTNINLYTAAGADTDAVTVFTNITTLKAYTTASAAANAQSEYELTNLQWYAMMDGTTGKPVAQYYTATPHWRNLTTCS